MNLPCPGYDEIESFVRGTLSSDRTASIEDHLDHCLSCNELVDRLESETEFPLEELGIPDLTNPTLTNDLDSSSTQSVVAQLARRALAPERKRIRDYQIVRRLGEGGMGVVYQALHMRLQKPVAIKVLSQKRKHSAIGEERFHREVRTVGQLDHPNIVRATDAGQENGQPYLVMEFIEGIDLSRLIRRSGAIPIADACEMIRQAATGLHYAHEHNIVHRDVKLSNLMLDRSGVVKVLDLGLATDRQAAPEDFIESDDPYTRPSSRHTQTDQFLGTVPFAAPEQTRDSRYVDRRADVFGLGRSLQFLIVGEVSLSDSQCREECEQRLVQAVSEPEVARIVARMTDPDPQRRYPTAQAVIEDLTPFCKDADLTQYMVHVPTLELEDMTTADPTVHASRPSPQELAGSTVPLPHAERSLPRKRQAISLAALLVSTTLLILSISQNGFFWQGSEQNNNRAPREDVIASLMKEQGGQRASDPLAPSEMQLINLTSMGLHRYATRTERLRLANSLTDMAGQEKQDSWLRMGLLNAHWRLTGAHQSQQAMLRTVRSLPSDEELSSRALAILSRTPPAIRESAAPLLIARLGQDKLSLQAFIDAIHRCGIAAIPHLVGGMSAGDPQMQLRRIVALRRFAAFFRLGVVAKPLRQDLIRRLDRMIRDTNLPLYLRRSAVSLIGELRLAELGPSLKSIYGQNQTLELSIDCLLALRLLKDRSVPAAALSSWLISSNSVKQETAALYLADLGSAATTALPDLKKGLARARSPHLQRVFARAIWKAGDQSEAFRVAQTLVAGNEIASIHGVWLLAELGRVNGEQRVWIREALSKAYPRAGEETPTRRLWSDRLSDAAPDLIRSLQDDSAVALLVELATGTRFSPLKSQEAAKDTILTLKGDALPYLLSQIRLATSVKSPRATGNGKSSTQASGTEDIRKIIRLLGSLIAVRESAAQTLVQLSHRPELLDVVRQSLRRVSPQMTGPRMLTQLTRPSLTPEERLQCFALINDLGHTPTRLRAAQELIKSPDPMLRNAALDGLQALGPLAAVALADVLQLAAAAKPGESKRLSHVLAVICDKTHRDQLLQTVSQGSLAARRLALSALALPTRTRPKSTATDTLIRLASDVDADVRRLTAQALSNYQSSEMVTRALIRLINDSNPQVQQAAIDSAWQLRLKSDELRTTLRSKSLPSSPQPWLAAAALAGLFHDYSQLTTQLTQSKQTPDSERLTVLTRLHVRHKHAPNSSRQRNRIPAAITRHFQNRLQAYSDQHGADRIVLAAVASLPADEIQHSVHQALFRLLVSSKSAELRMLALQQLSRIPDFTDDLIRIVQNGVVAESNSQLRLAYMDWLKENTAPSPRVAVDVLHSLSRSRGLLGLSIQDPQVAIASAKMLGQMEGAVEVALPLLVQCAKHARPSEPLRMRRQLGTAALQAITRLAARSDAALTQLVEMSQAPGVSRRQVRKLERRIKLVVDQRK